MEKMKKSIGVFLIIFLVLTLLPIHTSAASVKLNKTKVTLYTGSTVKLKLKGCKTKIKWTSSKKSVASVNSKGKVTAKKAGKAAIKAKTGKKTYTCTVTVKNPYLNKTALTLSVGEREKLIITGTKAKAWKSSKTEVADVSTNGKITAKKAGQTVITCKGANKKFYTCTVTVTKTAHKHSYKKTVLWEATCYTNGCIVYICEECGHSYRESILAGHKYTTTVIEPTCDDFGYTMSVCELCGNSNTYAYIHPYGHAYVETVIKEGTCTESGVYSYTCKMCQDTYEIEKYGEHTLQEIKIEASCTTDGITYYECSACGWYYQDYDSYTEMLPHEYAAEITLPGCETNGYTTYTCENCGDSYTDEYVSFLGHDYEEKILTEPNCYHGGEAVYTCKTCGDSYVNDLYPIHDWKTEFIEATCTQMGGKYKACTLCGEGYFYDDFIDVLPHDYEAKKVEPSCSEAGGTRYECKNCENSYYGEDYIEPLPHEYAWKVSYEPTCENDGWRQKECIHCGDVDYTTGERIDASGHENIELQLMAGEKCGICTVCNEHIFTLNYSIKHLSVNNQSMAYENEHVVHTVPGLSLEICIDNHTGKLEYMGDRFSLALPYGVYTEEKFIREGIEEGDETEETLYYYENDVVQVSYRSDSIDLLITGRNKGETLVDLCYDGKKIGEIPVSVDAYAFGEAVRQQMAGNPQATAGYMDRYAEMIKTTAAIFEETLTEDMTQIEKVQALCKWLEDNITYGATETIMYGQKAWETLEKRQAVCGGYAETVALFMDVLEIPCYYLYSNPPTGEGHGWNMIQMDADNGKGVQWYYVDTTWGEYDFIHTVDEMNSENAIPGVWGLHRAMGGKMLQNGYYMNVNGDCGPIDGRYVSPLEE